MDLNDSGFLAFIGQQSIGRMTLNQLEKVWQKYLAQDNIVKAVEYLNEVLQQELGPVESFVLMDLPAEPITQEWLEYFEKNCPSNGIEE